MSNIDGPQVKPYYGRSFEFTLLDINRTQLSKSELNFDWLGAALSSHPGWSVMALNGSLDLKSRKSKFFM